MANKIYLKSSFALREDTLENWLLNDPVLEKGEPAAVRDGVDGRWLKIGDGVSRFSELDWKYGPRGDVGPAGVQGEKGDTGPAGKDAVTDLTYSPESENAQSGTAVAEAFALKDFELLSDITLTEDVNEVMWTQTDDGEALQSYKDFFIYFLGSFTADVSERFQCRANNGSQYFMMGSPNKTTNTVGFWILIESVANVDQINASDSNGYTGITVKKTTFPADFLKNVSADMLATQGLTENNRQLMSDFCITSLTRTATGQNFSGFANLYIGQPSTATSIFASGSRFLLFGRK